MDASPVTLRFKFLIWCGMGLFLGFFYYAPEFFPLRVPQKLFPTLLDQRIPFLPDSAWIYQTLFILMPLAALTQPSRQSLLRFAFGFCVLVFTFGCIFWLLPTEIPFSISDYHSTWSYNHLIAAVDGHFNVRPSLHAALSIYAGVEIIRQYARDKLIRFLTVLWIIALLFSTLTTKQHYYIDLVTGSIIGFVAAYGNYALGKKVPMLKEA